MTTALCNTCFRAIPAEYVEHDGAMYLLKKCEEHGGQMFMVEKDAGFFKVFHHPSSKLYDGHFIDVTSRCNLDCSYCYHPKGGDVDKKLILEEADSVDCPIYLTGGEPTLRADLPEIISAIKQLVYLPTNGTGLLNTQYMKDLFKVIVDDNGYKGIALSYHREYPALFETVMETIKEQGYKIGGVIFTITDPNQLAECLEIADTWQDYVMGFRVHCATELWQAKQKPLFLSDVLKGFDGQLSPDHSKSVWVIGMRNKRVWAFVRWDTVETLDLENTNCGPYTTGQDGRRYHLTEAFIRNSNG